MSIRSIIVDTTASPNAKLRAVPASAVKLLDGFWANRIALNGQVTIPSQYQRCEETGRIDNFRKASGKMPGEFKGYYFNDSDVHKWLEAACWSLGNGSDDKQVKIVDDLIDLIAACQQPDGYLDTYFMGDRAKERWSNLKEKHEMYCAGHFIQAAVAHHRALGGDKALSVAMKLADCICAKFGPAEAGKTPGCCGHPEIEMALVELYRETQDQKYLDQAKYFLDARGHKLIGGSDYLQDHKPLREFTRLEGHAVRMLYLACGATDLCLERDEPEMRAMLEKLWTQLVTKQMYLTGGVGNRWDGEAFGNDYELPNATAYAETCGSIASMMWSWRMLLLTGDAKYADHIEQTMYNGLLSGIGADGESYFYTNPLSSDGKHRRVKWFDCACCPPNVARVIASFPGYCYSTSDDDAVWVHQFVPGSASVTTRSGKLIELEVQTGYPADGTVVIKTNTPGQYTIKLRCPAWCQGASITLNHGKGQTDLKPGYASITREWEAGDQINLDLPMRARYVEANPNVADDTGRVAIMSGPIVYCVEQVDNGKIDVRSLRVGKSALAEAEQAASLWYYPSPLETDASYDENEANWEGTLYRSVPAQAADLKTMRIRAVPYFGWANQTPGTMAIWLRRA